MNKLRSLKESGMALVEVMMAAGLVGGLALTVAKLSENGQRSVSRVEKDLEVSDLDREFNSYFANKTACSFSMQAPVLLSTFTGTSKLNIPSVKNELNIDVFAIPFKRQVIQATKVYITGYDPTFKTARLVKEYIYRLSPQNTVSKNKVSTLSISDDGAGKAVSCILKANEANGPWTVNNWGIYYDGGTVAIRKVPTDSVKALDVEGDFMAGFSNEITGALPAGNTIVAGSSNQIFGTISNLSVISGGTANIIAPWDTSLANSGIFAGQGNTVAGSRSIIAGGISNVVNASSSAIVGGEANTLGDATHASHAAQSFMGGGERESNQW